MNVCLVAENVVVLQLPMLDAETSDVFKKKQNFTLKPASLNILYEQWTDVHCKCSL